MRSLPSLLMFALIFVTSPLTYSDDWFRFRGPSLDGISPETHWSDLSDASDAPILWTKHVGAGLSGIVTSESLAFTMGNVDDKDIVRCLQTDDGKTVWHYAYDCPLDANEFEGGPTSTPTVDGDLVFTLGRLGQVHCFEKQTGKLLWQTNAAEENDLRVPGWGFAGSPLVVGDLLLLNIGEAGVALNKHTGELKWKSADKDAGYSSMIPIKQNGKPAVVFGSSRSYVCVEIDTGQELWRQRWLTTFGCNAADPIVVDNQIFISSGYNRGSALLKITDADPTIVWKHKDLQNQISTSVLIDGNLYGIHGDVDAGTQLRCVELATGELRWSDESFHPSAISASDNRFIIVTDEGELVIANASPKKLSVVSRHPVISGKCWTSPVLSRGLLYIRTADGQLTCFDLRQTTSD